MIVSGRRIILQPLKEREEMAPLFIKSSYDGPHHTGWHIRKNQLERTHFDNQSILFYDFGRLSCSKNGEKPLEHNIGSGCWSILFILEGKAVCYCNQEQFPLKRNNVLIFNSTDNIQISVTSSSRLEIYRLITLDSLITQFLLNELHQKRVLNLKNPEIIYDILRNIEKSLQTNLEKAGQTVLSDLAIQIFSLFSRISLQCRDFESQLTINQIGGEISCRPGFHYRLSDLAARCGLSPRSFQRQFTKIHGCSYRTYLIGAKIGLACILLKNANYTVNEIAALCQFSSISYFYLTFKKQIGITPLAFRRSFHHEKNCQMAALVRKIDEGKQLTSNRKTILWLLLLNSKITVSEIAEKMSMQRSSVQKNLEWLKAHNYICHQGSRRNGYWHILKQTSMPS